MSESTDQFQKLETKLSKVVEIFKRTQSENRSLAQQLEKLQAASREGSERRDAAERELQTLRREREDVRSRVEKLLEQVEALTRLDPDA